MTRHRETGNSEAVITDLTPSSAERPRPRRATRYHVARWDEETIRAALTEFLQGWDRWPTCREFAAGGAKGLREVIGRVHGPRWWAAEMGLPDGDRPAGGVRRWSDQAIADALTTLIGDSGRWPTSREFDEAGLHRLREALRHYGGPERWANELGVAWERPPQATRRRPAPKAKPTAPPTPRAWPKWTEQTIDAELRAFVDGRADWPRHREFVQTGRKGLYHAILKHGGTRVWAQHVGVEFSPDRRRGRDRALGSEQRAGAQPPRLTDPTDPGTDPLHPADTQPPRPATRPGPPVRRHLYWTDQRIAETIEPLVKQVGRWPTKSEFRRAGMIDALAAVYDHGGSARWRARFGVAARPPRGPVPSRRKWTRQRIDAELSKLCRDRTDWPTRAEFDAAGQRSLYEAVARNGGVAYWRDRFNANETGPR